MISLEAVITQSKANSCVRFWGFFLSPNVVFNAKEEERAPTKNSDKDDVVLH